MDPITKQNWLDWMPPEMKADLNNYAWLILGMMIAFAGTELAIPEAVWGGATGICVYKARGNGGPKP